MVAVFRGAYFVFIAVHRFLDVGLHFLSFLSCFAFERRVLEILYPGRLGVSCSGLQLKIVGLAFDVILSSK